MKRFIQYIKDTRSEFKHVSWPTKRQAIGYTLIIVAISLAVAFYLGAFDFLFIEAINLAL